MLEIITVLVIAGVLVWLFNYLIPMDARFKTVINVIIGVALFLYVMNWLLGGGFGSLGGVGWHHRC